MHRRWFVVVGLALASLVAAAAAEAGELVWQDCPTIKPVVSAATLRCGIYRPGESIAGTPITLGVARLQARPEQPSPHPILFVPGGPAESGGLDGSALSRWQSFQQQAGWPRDLVVFDPRSTGTSRPLIGCPPTANLTVCRREIGDGPVEALSIDAEIRDLHGLIAALDQGPVVLWAQSFGVFVAAGLAARYPGDVDSVILDSPASPAQTAPDFIAHTMQRAMDALLQACRAHLSCRLQSPSAPALLRYWLARTHRQAIDVPLAVVPERVRLVPVDSETLLAAILFAGYQPATGPWPIDPLRAALQAPAALAPLIAPVIRQIDTERERAPAYWSQRCQVQAENAGQTSPADNSAIRITDYRDMPASQNSCDDWPVDQRFSMPSIDTRQLWVLGSADIITPIGPALARVAGYPAARVVTVAGGGHLPLKSSTCALDAVGAWLSGTGPIAPIKLCSD